MGRIQDIWQKVKWAAEAAAGEWGLICTVFLVAFGSFGLGRLSATEAAKSVVSVGQAEALAEPRGMAIGGLIVASKSGEVYHYPWCGGASQIKSENRIWFASEDAAQTAGYSPSKSCKGLGSE